MKKLGHRQLVAILVLTVLVMIGIAYASVPLYRLFCSATGYNGTTQRVATAPIPAATKERWITVSFDSNVDSALPWDFAPVLTSKRIKVGEVANIAYRAHNRGDKTTVGTATFNVQPDKAGSYFDKIQCFCFTQQVLQPGESAELPVQFYIDPAINDDHQADDVKNITLSYTFFLAKDQSKAKMPHDMKNMSQPAEKKS